MHTQKGNDYRELYPEHNPHLSIEKLNGLKNEFQEKLRDIANTLKLNQKKYFISCWYISNTKLEDELMWRSYGKGSEEKEPTEGFMIKINLKDFIQNLQSLSSDLIHLKS
ncbi:putative Zn-dependent protease [Pedobacter sp. UYEF25]